MPVSRCMAEVSHREYVTWVARLQQEWNEPTLTDHYLMRLGQILMAANGDKDADMDKVRLTFKEKVPLTDEQRKKIVEDAKAGWLARMGIGRNKSQGG